MVLSLAALATAGVVQLAGHGYDYGHEAVAYAPVAHLAQYGGHEDQHVDYHVCIIFLFTVLLNSY